MPEFQSFLSPQEALRHLDEMSNGVRQGGRLSEFPHGPWSAEQMAGALQQMGWIARPVRASLDDLRSIECPFLAEAKAGGWALVLQVRGRRLRVQGITGPGWLSRKEFEKSLGSWIVETRPEPPTEKSLIGRLLLHLKRRRQLILWVGVSSLGIQLIGLGIPQLTRIAMDYGFSSSNPSLLTLVAVGLLLGAGFQALIGLSRQLIILLLETRLETEIGADYLFHVLNLPFSVLRKRRLSEFLQGMQGLDSSRQMLTEKALGAALDGSLALLYVAVMFVSMPGPALGVLLVALLMALMAFLVGRAQETVQREGIRARIRERGYMVEILKGIATCKSANAEALCLGQWTRLLKEELGLTLRNQRIGLWNEIGLIGIRELLLAGVLIWGGYLVLRGQAKIGSLMAFIQMASVFLGSVLSTTQAYLSWVNLKPQLAKTEEFLAETPEPPSRRGPSIPVMGPIRVENVWFRYSPTGPWVLRDYSLAVEPGEKKWIKAPSGFGKSTLLRLLAGLERPEHGSVRLGGIDPSETRPELVYLPQTIRMQGGSILENMQILSGGCSKGRLREAAEASGLAPVIEKLPMGYNTILALGGANLSGGQRQLVALTAAMASKANLILLDEAFANLDWNIRQSLGGNPWLDGKTIIYASHDSSFG